MLYLTAEAPAGQGVLPNRFTWLAKKKARLMSRAFNYQQNFTSC
jgi:hypothetical protein